MMNLDCNICFCPVTISFNNDKTLTNVDTHVYGKQHRFNMMEVAGGFKNFEKSFFCNVCDEPIWMSVKSNDDTISSVYEHINSQNHEACLEDFCNGSNDNSYAPSESDSEYDGSYPENNQHYYYDDNQSYYTDDDNSYYSEDGSDNYDEDNGSYYSEDINDGNNYNDGDDDEEDEVILLFNCAICACNIPVSPVNELTIDKLIEHIEGQRHQSRVEIYLPKRMTCMICQRNICLSTDIGKSVHNLVTHVNGGRHRSRVDVAESEYVQCGEGLYFPD